jgi:hypothetical protein
VRFPSQSRRWLVAALFAGALTGGCARPEPAPPGPRSGLPRADPRPVTDVRYEARSVGGDPHRVEVRATFSGGDAKRVLVVAPTAVSGWSLEGETGKGGGKPPGEDAAAHVDLDCRASCVVRYEVDLAEAARAAGGDLSVARAVGGDVIAPGATWLLVPSPLSPEAEVELRVEAASGRFATGLRPARSPDGSGIARYALRGWELRGAGYSVFGRPHTTLHAVPGGELSITVLDGPLELGRGELTGWVTDMALTLEHVFGTFPVPSAHVFLVPEPGLDDVEWGRTLPRGGPTVVVTVGEHTTRPRLYRDWIAIHELFHLGVPSFRREGEWLDEGLATYYEPILRVRAGYWSEQELWSELTRGLRASVPTAASEPLAESERPERIYWGGAAFALSADVEIRRRSSGRRTLDDGLRAVLAAGGNAQSLWTVDDFAQVVDRAVGLDVLERHVVRARGRGSAPWSTPEHLEALLRELGVSPYARDPSAAGPAPLWEVRDAIGAPFGVLAPDP